MVVVTELCVCCMQETQGVSVVTYGQSKDFPAFFTRDSGHQASYNLDNPTAVAKLIS